MAFCSNCGHPVAEQDGACGKCGKPLGADKPVSDELSDVPGWLGWLAVPIGVLTSIVGIALYSFWAYRRGRRDGVGRTPLDEPYLNFHWAVLGWGLAVLVPILGWYAVVHLPTLCYKHGWRVGAERGTAPQGFTSLPAVSLALTVPFLMVFAAAFAVGFISTLREGTDERVEELLSTFKEAYGSAAERQAQIDKLYAACSPEWIEKTARSQMEALHEVVPLTDLNAAAREVEANYQKLCADGDTEAFCEAQAQSLAKWLTEELDPSDIRRGCLQSVQQMAAHLPVDLQVGDCVVVNVALGEASAVDCSEPHDGRVTLLFTIEGDEYPGEEAVVQEAEQRCFETSGYLYLYPTKATWTMLGDRQVVCIIEVAYDLEVGDCINYSVDKVQRVTCSQPHDAEVVCALEMPGTTFPGMDAMGEYALDNCPRLYDTCFYPTEESWELGDRLVGCVEE